MACEYNTNGFCSLWSREPRPCTKCPVNNADTTPELRERIIQGRRRMNEVMLKIQAPPETAICKHRGTFQGRCSSCSADKYQCNLLGITVRTSRRPDHPNDIACNKDCPKFSPQDAVVTTSAIYRPIDYGQMVWVNKLPPQPIQHKGKLILRHFLSPGDAVVMTGVVRDIKRLYPQLQIDVDVSCRDAIFAHNPYITPLRDAPEARVIHCKQELIHQSHRLTATFMDDLMDCFNRATGLAGYITEHAPEVFLTDEEKRTRLVEGDYWVINAGYKPDCPVKYWGQENWRKLIDLMPDTRFVQVGELHHNHPLLNGENVIDLRGKTSIRQLFSLVYHAAGCISPVSFLMHVSRAVPLNPRFHRRNRPCIVIAGGREPRGWACYKNDRVMESCGVLPCCDDRGCWKSQLADCADRVTLATGEEIPRCMALITPDAVAHEIELTQKFSRLQAQDLSTQAYGAVR